MTRSMSMAGRDDYDALVVRTAYGDDQAWDELRRQLLGARGVDCKAGVWFIDDPAWAGASTDEVLEASRLDPGCCVVFIADAVAMEAARHALLAVTTDTRESLGDEEYEAETVFGREFRVAPGAVLPIEADRLLGRCDFRDYCCAAHEQPDGVFRGFEGAEPGWWGDGGAA
ncbi:DUF6924 domain-containing protein [Actinospica robiniae]|uniref:DUF6924 domain-containing protein n=1 Tax=Actinospica robiniae TaxID=304901 RepID=UPI0003F9EA7F|nr:hypothetical protein [Actinospica robiniae]